MILLDITFFARFAVFAMRIMEIRGSHAFLNADKNLNFEERGTLSLMARSPAAASGSAPVSVWFGDGTTCRGFHFQKNTFLELCSFSFNFHRAPPPNPRWGRAGRRRASRRGSRGRAARCGARRRQCSPCATVLTPPPEPHRSTCPPHI